jgi:hypothetical protein
MSLIEQIQQNAAQLPPDKQMEVLDFISFLRYRQQPEDKFQPIAERAQGVKKSLKNLARMRVFADINHPVAWQRSVRQDRPMPGRE